MTMHGGEWVGWLVLIGVLLYFWLSGALKR